MAQSSQVEAAVYPTGQSLGPFLGEFVSFSLSRFSRLHPQFSLESKRGIVPLLFLSIYHLQSTDLHTQPTPQPSSSRGFVSCPKAYATILIQKSSEDLHPTASLIPARKTRSKNPKLHPLFKMYQNLSASIMNFLKSNLLQSATLSKRVTFQLENSRSVWNRTQRTSKPHFLGKYSYHTDHSENPERPNSPYV